MLGNSGIFFSFFIVIINTSTRDYGEGDGKPERKNRKQKLYDCLGSMFFRRLCTKVKKWKNDFFTLLYVSIYRAVPYTHNTTAYPTIII